MTEIRTEGFELSPQQRRLWPLLHHGGSSPYRARCVVSIDGVADIDALRGSVESLSARLEILRTRYHLVEGMTVPLQVVSSEPVVELDVQDPVSSADASGAVDFFFENAERRGFDFARGPLFRMRLVPLSADRQLLLVHAPALATDARGLSALVGGIGRSIAARIGGEPSSEAILQYVDAASWLNELLDAEETALGREYWQRQDASSGPELQLPFEFRAPEESAFAPCWIPVDIDGSLSGAIESFGREHGVPPEVFFLTCWQCLLGRLLGETRVKVSLVSEGRSHAEVENAVGLFARALPVSGDLTEELSFAEALTAVGEKVREAQQWGDCFPPRVSFLPFSFQHRERLRRLVSGSVSLTVETLDDVTDRFKLMLRSEKTEDGWTFHLGYDRTLYDDDDVMRLGRQLTNLLRDAVSRPEARLRELRILSEAERRELRMHAPDESRRRAGECVHKLFEARARREPDAVAVVAGDEKLTYAELNDRADRLACALRLLGVRREVVVGLSLERSAEAIVGILGILKAGGAYLPLDPRLPKLRMARMLEDGGAGVVVTKRRLIPELPAGSYRVVAVDEPVSNAAYPTEATDDPPTPESLAYVLFTSGSTGRPKGVAVEHRQIVNYVEGIRSSLDLPPGASYATVSTFAADLGNTAIYPALCSGGCLHVVSEVCASDPEAFGDYVQRHGIDVLKIVPSHLEALLSGSRPAGVIPRKRLVLGGERSTWNLVDRVHSLAPDCLVFNHYGPTETTIGVTTELLTTGGRKRPGTPPIGRPIAGVRVYVLDNAGQPLPPWFPGELYIGGAAVSRGYLNDAELTRQKFIRDSFSSEPGARLYKSGDRVRMLPDGSLEFLGRVDDQVKIRGFRVELGEVEATACRVPSIREAAVVVCTEDSGEKRLVAYLVADRGHRPDAAEVMVFLKEQLPDFMVPASVVFVEALPLTPNGKLDRKALPAPPPASLRSASSEGPATGWESMIAEIWKELLHFDDVGVHDNFYDLGGHSLLAIQAVTTLEKRTGVHVSPRELIFHTLRQFAAVCESKAIGREKEALDPAK